jgi:hypothetical protein
MSKKAASWTLVAALVLSIVVYSAGGATGAESGPGSAADPVVTKSYVDELFASLSGGMQAEAFIAVEIEKGKKLLGGAGTELILRTGDATAIDNGTNGISDLTSGKDLMQGAPIAKNHLLLVPREDGRGIACKQNCWVLVKGAYTVQ